MSHRTQASPTRRRETRLVMHDPVYGGARHVEGKRQRVVYQLS